MIIDLLALVGILVVLFGLVYAGWWFLVREEKREVKPFHVDSSFQPHENEVIFKEGSVAKRKPLASSFYNENTPKVEVVEELPKRVPVRRVRAGQPPPTGKKGK